MEQALTQLAVQILFADASGFDKMMWTIIFARETEIMDIYMTWIRISLEYLHLI